MFPHTTHLGILKNGCDIKTYIVSIKVETHTLFSVVENTCKSKKDKGGNAYMHCETAFDITSILKVGSIFHSVDTNFNIIFPLRILSQLVFEVYKEVTPLTAEYLKVICYYAYFGRNSKIS